MDLDTIGRRRVMTLLGGAAIAPAFWPCGARAQQAKKPVLGFMHSASAADFPSQLTAFREGLKSGGFVDGQNLAIEYRWADGKFDRLPALAAELVRRKVDVIAAMGGGYSNLAAKNATSTIPIVFNTGADPVKMGLVSSLNRPGGNITGISFLSRNWARRSSDCCTNFCQASRLLACWLIRPTWSHHGKLPVPWIRDERSG
jgi:ABC-type uncharacterized transport system substrate-binding protein